MRLVRPLSFILMVVSISILTARSDWREVFRQPAGWYTTTEAVEIGDSVLAWQDVSGGWPKNLNLAEPPTTGIGSGREPTIDNDATTRPLQFLAKLQAVAPREDRALAIDRGIDYLLSAQYANGGWPQFFPLRKGYYSHITFNDNAMVNVLELLRAIGRAEQPWDRIDRARRARAVDAVARGVDCLLRTQVRVDGLLTAWCAQHDEVTLAPAPARRFEPVSLSGAESVGILRFLMGIERPGPEIEAAIEAGVAWLESVAIPGRRPELVSDAEGQPVDRVLVPDSEVDAWARFYQIGSNRPIFSGRDSVIHYDLAEVELERRIGYAYYGTWAEKLLTVEYPAWRQQLARESAGTVLFLAGDSTMADKPRAAFPERGWGQALRDLALPSIRVDNRAINGRSTRSFIDEGHWEALLRDLKSGDWVLIQFGHNDQKSEDPSRYADAEGDYRANLEVFIRDVRDRGAHPLLATSVARRKWDESGSRLVGTHGDYPSVVRAVSSVEDVPLLDLEKLTTDLEEARGLEGSKSLHLWFAPGDNPTLPTGLQDNTHYSMAGANAVARLAVAEMRRVGVPLSRYFADAVVALDGSGDEESIESAIFSAPQSAYNAARWVILVKPGIYHERVYVQRERGNIALIGTHPSTTTIVAGVHANTLGHDGERLGTFRTATLHIDGDDFILENLTVANDAGPVGQALALRIDGDRIVVRDCRFLGWQDTILVNRGRHYFADCRIEGSVDFIFGGANAVFDRCVIHCLGDGYISAASTPEKQLHGLTFLDCTISGEPDARTYLGRPWRAFAQTTFVRTFMDRVVRPDGWHHWSLSNPEETVRYVEMESCGPGGVMDHRVKWARSLSEVDLPGLTPAGILSNPDGWTIPSSLVRQPLGLPAD